MYKLVIISDSIVKCPINISLRDNNEWLTSRNNELHTLIWLNYLPSVTF